MLFNDDPNRSVSTAQEGQSEEQIASTQAWKGRSARPISPAKLARPFVRHRRLFRIMSVLLLILLFFTLVRLSPILISTNDQLLVQIGNQGTSIVDLRQNLPISPY